MPIFLVNPGRWIRKTRLAPEIQEDQGGADLATEAQKGAEFNISVDGPKRRKEKKQGKNLDYGRVYSAASPNI